MQLLAVRVQAHDRGSLSRPPSHISATTWPLVSFTAFMMRVAVVRRVVEDVLAVAIHLQHLRVAAQEGVAVGQPLRRLRRREPLLPDDFPLGSVGHAVDVVLRNQNPVARQVLHVEREDPGCRSASAPVFLNRPRGFCPGRAARGSCSQAGAGLRASWSGRCPCRSCPTRRPTPRCACGARRGRSSEPRVGGALPSGQAK